MSKKEARYRPLSCSGFLIWSNMFLHLFEAIKEVLKMLSSCSRKLVKTKMFQDFSKEKLFVIGVTHRCLQSIQNQKNL